MQDYQLERRVLDTDICSTTLVGVVLNLQGLNEGGFLILVACLKLYAISIILSLVLWGIPGWCEKLTKATTMKQDIIYCNFSLHFLSDTPGDGMTIEMNHNKLFK